MLTITQNQNFPDAAKGLTFFLNIKAIFLCQKGFMKTVTKD